ncbi:MAG TPA: M28 family metallopeptidase [Rhodanobacteraceae bacterium]|nr:M28 family metallopeptidase [Rhodanobacteraceae bacterium]
MPRLLVRLALPASLALIAACGKETPPPQPTAAAAPAQPAPVVPSAEGHSTADITAEDFAGRLKKISGDAFEGRKPGTIGERMTTAWIKDQFQQIGLKPGVRENWIQTVPMVETTLLDPDTVKLDFATKGGAEHLAYRTDMIVNSLDASHAVDIEGSEVVFAGYGVVAPEQNWNDYAGLDVKGKTVIVLVNDPGWGNHDNALFKGNALTYYGRWTYKYEEAARQGAAACLIVHETPGAGYPWDVVVNSWSGPQDALPPREDPAPHLSAAGWITTEAAQRLFAKAGQNFDELKKSADVRGFKPTALEAKLSTHFKNRVDNTSSENVLGLVRGSTRPDEVVVYSAHWDHLGKDASLKGDPIYNGAIDNGTGIAGLLEIAEAFAHQDPPPQRSVLIVAFTLEEAGLLGSRYYVTHPAFPLDKTVVDINMDALPILGPTKDIAVIGLGQSALDDYIKDAAAAQDRTIVADEAPEKGFFFRSDQLNFARLGVPVLYARSGLNLVDGGEEAGRKAYADYTGNRYHKPADEFDPAWDFRGVVQDLDALHAVGKKIADETSFPAWKADADFHRPAVGGG